MSKPNPLANLFKANRPAPPPEEIAAAQERVWLALAHHMDTPAPSPRFSFRIWLPAALATVAVLAIGTYTYPNVQQAIHTKQLTNAKVTITGTVALADVQKLADQRFTKITGVQYAQVAAALPSASPATGTTVASAATGTAQAPQATRLAVPSTTTAVGITTTPEVAAAQAVLKEAQKTSQPLYYSERELLILNPDQYPDLISGYFDISSGSTAAKHPKIDYSKPVTLRSWAALESSKEVMSQNNTPVFYSSYDGNKAVSYDGGAYAVKVTYSGNNLFSTLTAPEGTFTNPEVQFLQNLLSSDSQIQPKEGTLNGTPVYIIDLGQAFGGYYDFSPSYDSTLTQRLYVNKDTFEVQRIEWLDKNNTVVAISVLKETSTITAAADQKTALDDHELKGIPLKEVTYNLTVPNNGTAFGQPYFSDLIQKYPLYALETSSDLPQGPLNFADQNSTDTVSPLLNTTDFNPLYDDTYQHSYPDLVTFYQNNVSFSLSSYKITVPDAQGSNTTVTSHSGTLVLDGKSMPATITEATTITPDASATPSSTSSEGAVPAPALAPASPSSQSWTTRTIQTQLSNGMWLSLQENVAAGSPFTVTDGLHLKKITSDLATTYDAPAKAMPDIRYVENIDQLPAKNRYLLGDLSGTYQLHLMETSKSNRAPEDSTCTMAGDNESTNQTGCMEEKLGGYDQSYGSDTPVDGIYRNLQFYVLPASRAEVDSYLSQITFYDYSYGGESDSLHPTESPVIQPAVREVDGAVLVLSGSYDHATLEKILAGAAIDKDKDTIQQQTVGTPSKGSAAF